ncbi:MAG TPA: glycosyl hydrolase family 8 [Polyangiaceae bacterium]|nr:glycosyl hydrolase family 8 [Polyangiaceae bacterium]
MGSFPFPQDRKAANCTYPTSISHLKIKTAYQDWTAAMVTSSGAPAGALRVQDPMTSNQTSSEAMGYGMLIAVYMSDKKTFDAFWAYVQAHMSNGLMSWQVTSGGTSSGTQVSSATDADQDMAWALIMADKQWPGGSYLTAAKSILTNIKSQEVASSNKLKDGNFANAPSTYPDYAAPDYYKVFATVSGDSSWSSVSTAEYSQLIGAQNATTGLIPDTINGSTFGYDACRAPWRVGLDYCWNATAGAKSFLTPMVNYFVQYASQNLGPKSIKIPITSLSGGAGQNVSGAITGPIAIAAMMSASNQSFVDTSWSYLYSVIANDTTGSPNYFSSTVGLISMLAISGNFVDYTSLP